MQNNRNEHERTNDVFVCLKYLFRFRDNERGRKMEKEKAR